VAVVTIAIAETAEIVPTGTATIVGIVAIATTGASVRSARIGRPSVRARSVVPSSHGNRPAAIPDRLFSYSGGSSVPQGV
jgi:hypothetical protein